MHLYSLILVFDKLLFMILLNSSRYNEYDCKIFECF